MNLLNEVRPGANRYISGEGVLNDLPVYLIDFKRIVVITGEVSYRVFKEYYKHEIDYPTFIYDGSASEEDGARLADEIKDADVIIAIGGGRLIDTAKLATEILKCDLIIIPTLISNCAPYAPVIAVYTKEDHKFKHVGITVKSSYITFVDLTFLLATPREYFLAGIGDTLAKWYEIDGITRNLAPNLRSATVSLGIVVAKEILNTLLEDGELALDALAHRVVTPEFAKVADSIIALAGCVGGFAGEYGRVAGAHAIHDALSLIPATHNVLHGFKVAYGILVQLTYTKEFDEIKKLLPLYEKLSLPTSLKEINISCYNSEALTPVAKFAADKDAPFAIMAPGITTEDVLLAMEELEKFVASC